MALFAFVVAGAACGDDDPRPNPTTDTTADTTTGTTDTNGDGDGDGDDDIDVNIDFALVAGDTAIDCETSFTAGTGDAPVDLLDAKMYVTNVRLIDDGGTEVPVALTADDTFQSATVALLDFAGSGGKCEGADDATNTALVGTAPAGTYVGLVFEIGVPFDENHAELGGGGAPLDDSRMFWAWAIGRKFMRFDVSYGDLMADRFNFHLGSHMCPNGTDPFDASVPPTAECMRSNRPEVRFDTGFALGTSTVQLDLDALYGGLDVTAFPDAMRPGCQSFPPEGTECQPVYDGLDLDFSTGECKTAACAGQTAFSLQ